MDASEDLSGHGADWLTMAASWNGFERQAAVEALHRLRRSDAIPLMLQRTNDWVPQVRRAATLALQSFLDDAFIPDWAGALPELVALQRASRADHQVLLGQIAEFLAQPTPLARIMSSAAGACLQVRRYVYGLRWRAAIREQARYALLEESLGGRDIDLARQALAFLATLPMTEIPESVWKVACASRYAEVRIAALRLALRAVNAARRAWLFELRFDPSMAVAAAAWEAAKHHIPLPVFVVSLEGRVSDERRPAALRASALAMLCRLDADAAATCCVAAAGSPLARLRCVALAFQVSRSDGRHRDDLLLQSLRDASPRVRRVAVDAAHRGVPLPGEADVLGAALKHGSASALRQAMAVLSHAPSWARLHCVLLALNAVCGADAKAPCLQALAQWQRDMLCNFQSPSPTQKAGLGTAWGAARACVPQPLAAHVEFELRNAGVPFASQSGSLPSDTDLKKDRT